MEMSKRIFQVIAIMLAVAAVIANGENKVEASTTASVIVNGEEVRYDVPPMMDRGRVLVPMRMTGEALGIQASWSQRQMTATFSEGINIMELNFSTNTFLMNNESIKNMDVEPRIQNGRVLVPLRILSEEFGHQVVWSGNDTRQVQITTERNSQPEDNEGPPAGGDDSSGTDKPEVSMEDMRPMTRTMSVFEMGDFPFRSTEFEFKGGTYRNAYFGEDLPLFDDVELTGEFNFFLRNFNGTRIDIDYANIPEHIELEVHIRYIHVERNGLQMTFHDVKEKRMALEGAEGTFSYTNPESNYENLSVKIYVKNPEFIIGETRGAILDFGDFMLRGHYW